VKRPRKISLTGVPYPTPAISAGPEECHLFFGHGMADAPEPDKIAIIYSTIISSVRAHEQPHPAA